MRVREPRRISRERFIIPRERACQCGDRLSHGAFSIQNAMEGDAPVAASVKGLTGIILKALDETSGCATGLPDDIGKQIRQTELRQEFISLAEVVIENMKDSALFYYATTCNPKVIPPPYVVKAEKEWLK